MVLDFDAYRAYPFDLAIARTNKLAVKRTRRSLLEDAIATAAFSFHYKAQVVPLNTAEETAGSGKTNLIHARISLDAIFCTHPHSLEAPSQTYLLCTMAAFIYCCTAVHTKAIRSNPNLV